MRKFEIEKDVILEVESHQSFYLEWYAEFGTRLNRHQMGNLRDALDDALNLSEEEIDAAK